MDHRLEALAARLQALEDREAIRALIAAYGPRADAGEAEAVAALWTADGVYEVNGFAPARGHAAIAALITGPVHQGLMAAGCGHLLGPVDLELAGDRATARGHSVVFRHAADGWVPVRVAANRWTLARTGAGAHGGWQVTHRHNALLDGAEAARALLATTAG